MSQHDRPHVPRQSWQAELDQFLTPFLAHLPRVSHGECAVQYVCGLLGPTARKSLQPLAEFVCPDAPGSSARYQRLHHFLTTTAWAAEPLDDELARTADRVLGGDAAMLIIDDTAVLKRGMHSVGVARQYAGEAGHLTHCQVLVSLTLARDDVPLPVALRVFLPAAWTDRDTDPTRCARAGVPDQAWRRPVDAWRPLSSIPKLGPKARERAPRPRERRARVGTWTKWELALRELDRLRTLGVRFGVVLADAAYGSTTAFRLALTARGLQWAVGIRPIQYVYPAEVTLIPPEQRVVSRRTRRRPVYPQPSLPAQPVTAVFTAAAWQRVTWRQGTRAPLTARFAARRVRLTDGPYAGSNRYLPGDEVWLVGEQREDGTGTVRYYVSNLPARTPLLTLVRTLKARWVCEQAHEQLKNELGLDHFEGRHWTGLQHHLLWTLITYAFLQTRRLQQATPGGEKKPARAPVAQFPNRPPHDPAHGAPDCAPALSHLPCLAATSRII